MCSVTNCAHVREDYARARIQSTMMHPGTSLIKNYHFVLVHHFVPISPYCPKMKNTLICQWFFTFQNCFGLSYIHVSQASRKKIIRIRPVTRFELQFCPCAPFCPNFTILSQNEKALICQWNSPFESCFGLSYIHVSQILRKK